MIKEKKGIETGEVSKVKNISGRKGQKIPKGQWLNGHNSWIAPALVNSEMFSFLASRADYKGSLSWDTWTVTLSRGKSFLFS